MTIPGNFTLDMLYSSRRLLEQLAEALPAPREPTFAGQFAGMKLVESDLYPFTQGCSACEGSGSGGKEATYCPKCRGGGKVTYLGHASESPGIYDWRTRMPKMVILCEYHPVLFQASFPADVPVPLRAVSYTRC